MDRREFLQVALLSTAALKVAACTDATCDPAVEDCSARYPFFVASGTCTACGKCIPQCGKKAFQLKGGTNVVSIDFTRCTRCGSCFLACEAAGYHAVIESQVPDGYMYEIDQDLCQKCLNCHKVCTAVPDKAIVQSNLEPYCGDNNRPISDCLSYG